MLADLLGGQHILWKMGLIADNQRSAGEELDCISLKAIQATATECASGTHLVVGPLAAVPEVLLRTVAAVLSPQCA